MGLRFTYYFDNQTDEPYYYEADSSDAADYIVRTHEPDDIIRDYIDAGLYEKENEENKEILKTYDDFDGTYESITNMDISTMADLVDEILVDMLYDTDIYDDELEDYFEQTAYDEYDENTKYSHTHSDDDWFNR